MRRLEALGLLAGSALALCAAAPAGPRFSLPIACEPGRTCEIQHYVDRDPGPGALDYRCQHRTYQGHDGVDIRLPDLAAQRRGVSVLAAAPGTVLRVRDGVADVSVRTVGRETVDAIGCGNAVVIDHGGGWISGYCHMAKGSVRVKPGDKVAAGTPIGRVGLSGLTEFPHLHFMLRQGERIVDPFAPGPVSPGSCAAQASLWTPAAAQQLGYKAGVILNMGLAGAPVTNESIEAGGLPAATAAAPAIVAYGRVIEPQAGDVIEVTLRGPGGGVLATQKLPPLDRDKAQYFQMVGKKRPATGWPKGAYTGEFKVWRAGKVALERRASAML